MEGEDGVFIDVVVVAKSDVFATVEEEVEEFLNVV